MFDLHCHTTFSDGASQPEDLIEAALNCGIQAIAITDHDNTEAFPVAQATWERLCAENPERFSHIELIPGIEINTHWQRYDIHVLGFFIDRQNPGLQTLIQQHRQARVEQMHGFVKQLSTKAGLRIDFDDIAAVAKHSGSLGRPHIASALLQKGLVPSIGDAFQKYLSPQSSTYCRRETVRPHEAVEIIYESGGIPVIAHPGDTPHFDTLVVELMDYGLCGLEAYHRSHSPGLIEYHCSLAEKYGLIVTGGTDYHGVASGYANSLGRLKVPAQVLDRLKAARNARQRASFRVA